MSDNINYNDKAKRDCKILLDKLYDLMVKKESGSALSENTLLWTVIRREVLLILNNGCFYLGLGNELLPSGVDSVNDLIRNIKTLKLKQELEDGIIRILEISDCFKLNKENGNDTSTNHRI